MHVELDLCCIFESILPPEMTYSILTEGDSAASNLYFVLWGKNTLINVQPKNPPATILLPNHSLLKSNLQGKLPVHALTAKATNSKLFDT